MALRDLYGLDRTSAQFPDQLDQFFHDENHVRSIQDLPGDEFAELLKYLDEVRFLFLNVGRVLLISRPGSRRARPYRPTVQEVLPGSAEDMRLAGDPSSIIPTVWGSFIHKRTAGCVRRIL